MNPQQKDMARFQRELDAEEARSERRFGRLTLLTSAILLLMFGGFFGWIILRDGAGDAGILRPEEPVRVRPETARDREKRPEDEVYELLETAQPNRIERLLPEPEPIEAETPESESSEERIVFPEPLPPPRQPESLPDSGSESIAEAETPPPQPQNAESPSADRLRPFPEERIIDTVPQASGDWFVQLASMRSRSAAEAAEKRLRARHPQLLSALPFQILQADLAEKGIFFRVFAGPFASAQQAERLCARLKQQETPCFVRRTRGNLP